MNKQLNEITIEDVNMRSVTFKNLLDLVEKHKTDEFNLWSDVAGEISELLNLRQRFFLLHASESTRERYMQGYSSRGKRHLRMAKNIRMEATEEYGSTDTSHGVFAVLREVIRQEENAHLNMNNQLAESLHREFMRLCKAEYAAKKKEDDAKEESEKVRAAILECWFKGRGMQYSHIGPAYVKSLLDHNVILG